MKYIILGLTLTFLAPSYAQDGSNETRQEKRKEHHEMRREKREDRREKRKEKREERREARKEKKQERRAKSN